MTITTLVSEFLRARSEMLRKINGPQREKVRIGEHFIMWSLVIYVDY
jgi:hypothetical protein